MRLAAPESVLTVLGIQTSTGSLAAAGAALDATFPTIESFLDTKLLAATRIDYFDLSSVDRVAPSLRLACSFVSKDASIVVEYSNDSMPLSTGNRSTLDATSYIVDYDTGVVHLASTFAVTRRSVAITYTAGFEADIDNPLLLVGLPDALVQGAISKAAAYMLLNPANVAKDKARFMADTAVHGVELKGRQALDPYIRPRATAVWHSYSEILE